MLALTEVIDFLLNLMRDETARAEFEQDPQGTLARAGLEGVTGQDIADARLLLADSGTVSSSADDGGGAARSSSYEDNADPIRQINHTTQHFQVADAGPADSGGEAPELSLLRQSSPSVSGDSFFFQTFSSDDDVTIIDDSFNTIDNSNTDVSLTNIEATNSFNQDSFTTDDDVVTIDAENSFNSSDDDTVVAIRDDDTIIEDNDVVVENSLNGTETPELAAVSGPAQPPAEPAPAPDLPADETPEVEAPVDEAPIDEAPIEEAPIDEAPVDEAPLDEAPVDDPVDEPADPTEDAADALPV
ncbi:MAG TPA: IniB N-terminal domain-containing protein [Pseudonocardia sp.]|nr:IniB N-terminal domain-containing protein [Pseudonocardia sp.]